MEFLVVHLPNAIVIIGTCNDRDRNTINRNSFVTQNVFKRFNVLFSGFIRWNAVRCNKNQKFSFSNFDSFFAQNITKNPNDWR